jgi:hypothetical protein
LLLGVRRRLLAVGRRRLFFSLLAGRKRDDTERGTED